jgi:hypothetical protein
MSADGQMIFNGHPFAHKDIFRRYERQRTIGLPTLWLSTQIELMR